MFGAKVLGSPSFLTPKNISDIENNRTDGKTTKKHQHVYRKILLAALTILLAEDEEVATGGSA